VDALSKIAMQLGGMLRETWRHDDWLVVWNMNGLFFPFSHHIGVMENHPN